MKEGNADIYTPLVVDKSWSKMQELATFEETEMAMRKAYRHLDRLILQRINRPTPETIGQGILSGTWNAENITPFLKLCRELVEKELEPIVAEYSSFQWLWYLRRLPVHVFSGNLQTTFGYDSLLAEIITGFGQSNKSFSIRDGQIEYDVNQKEVRHILRLCAHVRFLSLIHVLLRYAGKEAKFFFTERGLPEKILTNEQEASIQLYDTRAELDGLLFSGSGTVFSLENITDNSKIILGVNRVANPEFGSGFHGTIEQHTTVKLFKQFGFGLLPLPELEQFISDPRSIGSNWMQPAVGSLLLLLALTFPLLTFLKSAMLSLQRYGYIIISEQAPFKEFVNDWLEWLSSLVQPIVPDVKLPSDAQQMLDILDQSKGSPWPLRPGPPLRLVQTGLCIDVYAATAQLNHLIRFSPVGGEPDNLRAHHFEVAVQRRINASFWCPPKSIKDLRGVHLKHPRKGNNAVAEIDAIGVKGDTLLIVSCKSMPYSEKYDAGDFYAMRNVRTTIESAIDRWNDVRNFLENNPKGNNYDFSDYRQIIAVVCTPRVHYVLLGQSTQFIAPGLRAAVSYQELITWLSFSEQEA